MNAIFQSPEDDTARLVYADWLEERGDARSEFLRLDVEFSRLPRDDQKREVLQVQFRKFWNSSDSCWCDRVSDIRGRHRDVVQLAYFVDQGSGQLEVLGGAAETALLVEGMSIAFNWDDCHGSVGQYLVQVGNYENRNQESVHLLNEIVSGRIQLDPSIAEKLKPILSRFASGIYALVYTPSNAVNGDWSQIVSTKDMQNYYPYGRNLVCTQSAPRSVARVEYFRNLIRSAQRPIVLTASALGAWCEFVIDGHHKLEAYHCEHKAPAILCVERWDARPISLEMGVGFLPGGHPGVREYQRMKRGGV